MTDTTFKPDFNPRSDFLRILTERGYIHQASDLQALDDLAADGRLIAYVGYDCTAPSLHIGHLLSIMMLHWLQATGNKPITLMGGGTTRVGDPSGKDETRQLLTVETIDANKDSIKGVFECFLQFGDATGDALMVDNAEWLTRLNYIEMLRDVGRHFSVNRMLSMDSVRLRLEREHELSFIEFNYMILQSYDFVELARRYGCNLQMGGSDQWGNIVNGIELTRRVSGNEVFGLTVPLLTTSGGAKMGKTAAGAVWLNADHLAPYDYWQFWRNTADADVAKCLRLFTELPMSEIERLAALEGAELNEAKKILATQVTAIVHGPEEARGALQQGNALFSGEGEIREPTHSLPLKILADGLGLLELVVAVGFAASNGEARRLVEGGGVRLNNQIVDDVRRRIATGDLQANDRLSISVGKRRKALVGFE